MSESEKAKRSPHYWYCIIHSTFLSYFVFLHPVMIVSTLDFLVMRNFGWCRGAKEDERNLHYQYCKETWMFNIFVTRRSDWGNHSFAQHACLFDAFYLSGNLGICDAFSFQATEFAASDTKTSKITSGLISRIVTQLCLSITKVDKVIMRKQMRRDNSEHSWN